MPNSNAQCRYAASFVIFMLVIAAGVFNVISVGAAAGGDVDATFDTSVGADSFVLALATQPDGKVLIGGDFTTVGGVTRNRIARLNADGNADTTFDTSVGANDKVYAVALQPDGKVIVAGVFTSVNGVTRNRVARLNFDGSLDTSFNPSANSNVSNASSSVFAVIVQPDGKILIGGTFTVVNGLARNRIARLLNAPGTLAFTTEAVSVDEAAGTVSLTVTRTGGTDNTVVAKVTAADGTATMPADYFIPSGDVDTSFNPGEGLEQRFNALAVQTDGKVLISAYFSTTVDGAIQHRIARLNTDGSPDTSFSTNANDRVTIIVIQPDGKILIGGLFTMVNGVSRNRIARLNINGSLDTSFDSGTNVGYFTAIVLQSNGKILVGGSFTNVNNVSRNNVARLNPNGSVDATFDTSLGANGTVNTIAVQTDGKVIIGGNFSMVNNVPRSKAARLNTDGSLDTSFNLSVEVKAGTIWVTIQPDGKLIITGALSPVNNVAREHIVRLYADGSRDTSFSYTGGGFVGAIALQPDGKILIGDSRARADGNVARINTDGSIDPLFRAKTNNNVYVFAVRPDGKIIIGGDFTSVNGIGRQLVARLHNDIFVTFPAGDATSKTVTIPIVNDTLDESDENFTLSITPLSGGATAAAPATITITDNDIPPLITSQPPAATTTVGVSYSHTFTATGAPTPTFTISGTLPPGLIFTPNSNGTATLAGMPTAAGTYGDITVTASNGVAPAAMQTFTITVRSVPTALAPVADTYVQGADAFRYTNFGSDPTLQVKRTLNPGSGRGRRGFLRFETASVAGTITAARLRIFARLTDANLPPTGMIVQKVTDTAWDELAVTWDNQPPTHAPNALASITVTDATGQYYEFDLTAFIQAERAAGRTAVSFRLINQQSTGNSGAFFTSVNTKEAETNPPQLVIQN